MEAFKYPSNDDKARSTILQPKDNVWAQSVMWSCVHIFPFQPPERRGLRSAKPCQHKSDLAGCAYWTLTISHFWLFRPK